MRVTAVLPVLLLSFFVLAPLAAEEKVPEGFPQRDAEKYPQDTPEHALGSISTALSGEDFAYFTAWLVTPDSTQRSLDKFKTLDAAVEDQKNNPAKVAGRKAMLDTITQMQKNLKRQEDKSAEKDAPVRFMTDDVSFLQFEKQKDGRWCLNPRARSAK